MKKIILLVLLLVPDPWLSAQQREIRELPGFTALEISRAVEVKLVPGTTTRAEVVVSGDLELADLLTTVRGQTLVVRLKGTHQGNSEARVVLTYRQLGEIEVSSAASLTNEGALAGDRLEIEVSGAGSASLRIDVAELEAGVDTAGKLTLSGKAGNQEVEVSSAGQYDALKLACRDARVEAGSAGTARVSVAGSLEAEAGSGGTIRYSGKPERLSIRTGSAGTVKKIK